MDDAIVVQTRDLTKRYGDQTAVDRLNFTLREGEIFGFLGPNGAGKTTTLLMLMGLTQPSGGSAVVCGLDPVRRAKEVKRLIGYMPENVGFYPELDAVQSLEYIAALNGIPESDSQRKIGELLDLVGLKKDAHKKVANYSRGMRQRLGIAEVLIKDPKVLFLDEPTLGLDPEAALNLIDLIARLKQEHNMTVLLSSHHLHQVQKISDRVGIMINGKLVAQGTLEALAQEKFGLGDQKYSLEEIYMKYFQEG
ncbi:MAG: ABC transporter ATP-binding protein [Deltaproteobacteria bacterium]|nr:ABC transporter ATP-binding protein [Deltaproteobacteria bacterium]MBW1929441.1 ABC transporter ATP-binding protein [Deltaproteobacteria bacterium]MBW2023900.1 ABC transporter ATP-binding protein [Deltaproteobacteria bacterium]MBW2124189.1 ABC transporter ATP-binding protein [Deltaproteobacteria bacterium]RLB18468.1 MAG: ABC transporter ATP-binding protein [Deltaproteobacteria bacterium]